ncbi:MAG TPA: enoyl-CoA hydratase/isomerase family protein [Chloroflexota bacterium]|jgi:enoyl-CoA hydratase/carnithine racemase|nr:enoyl-CoA hydratase/isomerase family protein [Chloroflexota bacterium]
MAVEAPAPSASAQRHISLDKRGGVGYLTFDKPKANTYDYDFIRQLNDCVNEIRLDSDIKSVVVKSDVPKFFSAGAEISMLKAATPDYKACFCLEAQETLRKIERTPKVFIAALTGHTVGGGLEIALAMDLRFAATEGFQIGLPEITLGVLPGTGGTQRLTRLIGPARALDLMISGRLLTPQEAFDFGIVEYLYPADQVLNKAVEYAENLAKGPARASGLIKLSVKEGNEVGIESGLFMERELQNRLFRTEDAQEGLQAWLDKRTPEFHGR